MEQLQTQSYSLAEFNAMSEGLHAHIDHDPSYFLKFVLAGNHPLHQAVVDPLRGSSIPAGVRIDPKRDYDSGLGLGTTILVDADISITLVPKHQDTLLKSIHLSVPIKHGDVGMSLVTCFYRSQHCLQETIQVPVHKIPNIGFGRWKDRHLLRILFPQLYSEDRSFSGLTKDECKIFYEHGLRPAVGNLSPKDVAEYPVTYDDELFRARNPSGTLSLQTRMIARDIVPGLVPEIEAQLLQAGALWGSGMLVLHELRGIKATTGHQATAFSAMLALDAFMTENHIMRGAIQEDLWWIDVGVEFMVEGRCLQWRTDSHSHIMKSVAGISDAHARRVTSLGSSQYSRDLSSHLSGVAGCRIEPGVRAQGPNGIRYLQLYSTDKALTYHPGRYHTGKALTCVEAMGDEQPTPFCASLYDLYKNSRQLESHARIEARVPVNRATDVLLDLDNITKNPQYFVAFHPSVWW